MEDNQEFRLFLKEQLEDFYQIIEAADGEEGERKSNRGKSKPDYQRHYDAES